MGQHIELNVVVRSKHRNGSYHVEPNCIRLDDIEYVAPYYASNEHKANFGGDISMSKIVLKRPFNEEEMAEREKQQRSDKPARTKPLLVILEDFNALSLRMGAVQQPAS